jgi:hypothetical protein
LESRFTLGSEAHGISDNRQEETEDLVKMKTYSFNFSPKIKTQNKEKRKNSKKIRKRNKVAGTLCSVESRKDAISLNKQTQNL